MCASINHINGASECVHNGLIKCIHENYKKIAYLLTYLNPSKISYYTIAFIYHNGLWTSMHEQTPL